MRFARRWKEATGSDSFEQGSFSRVIFIAYNLVWWLPILLPIAGFISYEAGFVSFTIVTLIRLIANLYRNNVLSLEKAVSFPFRIP